LLGHDLVCALLLTDIAKPAHEELLVTAGDGKVVGPLAIADRQLRVGERLVVAAEQRPCLTSLVVEVGKLKALQIVRHLRIGCHPQWSRTRRIRLLLIENGGDVGDRARRRNETRLRGLGDIRLGRRLVSLGGSLLGQRLLHRRLNAGLHLGLGLLAAGLEAPAASLHAGYDDGPADAFATAFNHLLGVGGQGRSRSKQNK
jgi:hypothetical protein